jgi:hypothetical protein
LKSLKGKNLFSVDEDEIFVIEVLISDLTFVAFLQKFLCCDFKKS